MNIYENDKIVEQFTKHLLKQGTRVFQIWKKGHDDRTHCEWLLNLAQFPLNASVLDIACGVGTVALHMNEVRPDLRFSLQNVSSSQLELCPRRYWLYEGSMDTLQSVPNKAFDAAMVCYALGHVEYLAEFFHNAARVLKPGGQLFVYDVQPLPGWEQWALDVLGYRTYTIKQLVEASCVRERFSSMHVLEEVSNAVLNCHEFLNCCPMINAVDVCTRTKPVGYKFTKSTSTYAARQAA